MNCIIHFVNIASLGVREKWDIADLNDDYGEINVDDAIDFVLSTKQYIPKAPDNIDKNKFPLRSEKGNPINAYENLEYLLNHYRMITRYNEIKKDVEVDIPHKNFTKSNKSKLILAELTGLCIKNGVPRADIPQWLLMISDNNSYNPVKEYILSFPWDGIGRINDFINTLECHNNRIRDILVYRWMIGAVAVGLSKTGLAHPGVLTLLGKQYCGKSSWFLSLLPPDSDLCLGDYNLNPADKDSVRTATRFWLTELSEVDGAVRKSDVSAMKSFLTRKLDVYRCPYDRADTEAPRNTAFVATVNDDKFLKDTTGNRRWWIVDVIKANAEHGLNMQQVWAEFYHYYLEGHGFHLTKEEFNLLMDNNEDHTVVSTIEELIRDRYMWEETCYRKCSATQVLFECEFNSNGNLKGNDMKECHRILRLLTNEKPKIIRGVSTYLLPRLNPRYQIAD
jgi:putative DNA primase/helicase